MLLAKEGTNQILRCPECRTIFYRHKKQLYCSRTCANRAGVHAWRQREEVKLAEAERAHVRYVDKTRVKAGKEVKLQRRSQKEVAP